MHHYEAYVAGSGYEGLRLIDTINFDFIILDINLPDMDGSHICQHIRQNTMIPIMILSARTSDADKVIALGFGAVFTKEQLWDDCLYTTPT